MKLIEGIVGKWYVIDDPGPSRLKKEECILLWKKYSDTYHIIGEGLCDEIGLQYTKDYCEKIIVHDLIL